MELGHNVMHGQYDWMNDKSLNGATYEWDIVGTSDNWRKTHNYMHHTYTNIGGLDEDIETGVALRMTPEKPLMGFHKYQHIYAWGLYCLMNIYWVTAKDYIKISLYKRVATRGDRQNQSRIPAIAATFAFFRVDIIGILSNPSCFHRLHCRR